MKSREIAYSRRRVIVILLLKLAVKKNILKYQENDKIMVGKNTMSKTSKSCILIYAVVVKLIV